MEGHNWLPSHRAKKPPLRVYHATPNGVYQIESPVQMTFDGKHVRVLGPEKTELATEVSFVVATFGELAEKLGQLGNEVVERSDLMA